MAFRHTVFAAMALFCATASAQTFPNRPIQLIVPFPPGGGTDVVARMVAPKMGEALGVGVIVTNRAGAGGNIGMEYAARSAPDGYTMVLASSSAAINTTLSKNLGWDLEKDFDPIVLLAFNQSLLVVNPSVPVSTVAELIALAKKEPGKLTFASSGIGSSAHMGGELFKMMAGVNLLHVPYKGAGPALNDLLGGQVDIMVADISGILPQVQAGKLKVLGIGSPQRFAGLPNVPTISESGVPGYSVSGLIGLLTPAGTPRAAIDKLNAAANKALADPVVRRRLTALAEIPEGGAAQRLKDVMRRDVKKWAEVIHAANLHEE
jgi:tripartite-type tricarboxylate transporter receptor subunit TctC